MKRVVSPFGVRTALATGFVMLSLTPAAALASHYACSGSISAPASARQGAQLTVTANSVEGSEYWLSLFDPTEAFLSAGLVVNNGNFTVTATVPSSVELGGVTLLMETTGPDCIYQRPITILPNLIITPGVTITIPPALTTTTAAQQATTTTAAPQSTSTTTASSTTTTVPASTSTTESLAETTTSAVAETTTSVTVETTLLDSTSTSLVAAARSVNSDGGQPWSAWITGGLIGLMLGGTGMLLLMRKGVLKV